MRTVTESVTTLDHLYSGMLSQPVIDLAGCLSDTLPDPLERTLLLTTGAESNEAAVKLAKLYTGKFEIVAFDQSWHGMSSGAASATFSAGRRGYGPLMPGMLTLPTPNAYRSPFRTPDGGYDWEAELDYGFRMLDRQSTGNLAACIVEPILSSGGSGRRHAWQPEGVPWRVAIIDEPRRRALYVCIRRAVSYGHHHPLQDLSRPARRRDRHHRRIRTFTSGASPTTHVSDPLAAAVAVTVLDVVERDELVERAAHLGTILGKRLGELRDTYEQVGDVRGRGLLQGIELVEDKTSKTPADGLGQQVTAACLERGLHMNIVQLPGMGGIFRIAPPLTIEEDDLHKGVDILEASIRDVVVAG